MSLANWDNIPATKASPAPVVSTCSTLNPPTLPQKSYIDTHDDENQIFKSITNR